MNARPLAARSNAAQVSTSSSSTHTTDCRYDRIPCDRDSINCCLQICSIQGERAGAHGPRVNGACIQRGCQDFFHAPVGQSHVCWRESTAFDPRPEVHLSLCTWIFTCRCRRESGWPLVWGGVRVGSVRGGASNPQGDPCGHGTGSRREEAMLFSGGTVGMLVRACDPYSRARWTTAPVQG